MNPSPCLRIVITGTGTEIGKTHFAVRLLEALRPRHSVLGLKPIESGYVEASSDATQLRQAAGGHHSTAPLHCFDEPISPHLAARRNAISIDLPAISDWVRRWEARSGARVVAVETAGGLFTPLAEAKPAIAGARPLVNLDLVRALEPCRWVLVAPDRLGVLHDVLAARAASSEQHRLPDLVALTHPPGSDSGLTPPLNNLAELRRFCGEPIELIDRAPPLVESWLRSHIQV